MVALLASLGAGPAVVSAQLDPPEVELQGDAHAGHVTVRWTPLPEAEAAPRQYELQEAFSQDFDQPNLRYRGGHTSSVISGLPDGTRFFRVRQRSADAGSWSDWSKPARFQVEHHSLRFALSLLGVGAVVFAAIVGFLMIVPRTLHRD